MTPNPQYPGSPGAAASPRTSGLAIAALVTGLLGICLPCPFALVSIGLGIAALVKINREPGLGGKALAIIGIAAPLVALPIFAAIALPNFMRFQARSKQIECKSNLKSAYAVERSFYAERNAYSPVISEVGFSPERGNRYAYFLSDSGPVEDRSSATPAPDPRATGVSVDTFKYRDMRPLAYGDVPAVLAGDVKPGVKGECPKCSFTAICAANIDRDETLDVWSISTEPRTGPKGETIPAGEPHNDLNDVTD